jgi:hypothetical protein
MKKSPAYGVGIAYRRMFHADIMRNRDSIDFLEVPTIEYITRSRRVMQDPTGTYLRQAHETFPCVAHGINLSVGTVGATQEKILTKSREFLDEFEIDEFSDHLTYHRGAGKNLTVFMAMPFDEAAAQWIANQYNNSRRIVGQPFGLEIVTYPFPVAGSDYTEVEFINKIAEYTDCWFLLDAANLFYNSSNHKYDPIEFLDKLPGERVQHIHIAGGHKKGDEWIDSHNNPVHPEVFELLDECLKRTAARAIILERDEPPEAPETFGSVVEDLQRAKEVFLNNRPAELPQQLLRDGPPVFVTRTEIEPMDLDNLPPDVEQLKRYQESLITAAFELSEDRYHNYSPEQIINEFDLSADWKERWHQMDWKQMIALQNKLRGIKKFNERSAKFYQMAELAAWANRMGGAEHIGT